MKEEKMENVEELEGCMCQYIPETLREQVDTIAEKFEAYPHQVVGYALQIGLALLISKHPDAYEFKGGHGRLKQTRKSRLSGKGV
jgi:hypothetical protein